MREAVHLVGCLTLMAVLGLFLCAGAVEDDEEEGEASEDPAAAEGGRRVFWEYVEPLRAEAGPILSPAIGAVPSSRLWGSVGLRYAKTQEGLGRYSVLQTAVVLGGEWSSENLPRLGLGADLVAFTSTTLLVDLPPVIHESRTFYDLGPLRIRGKLLVLEELWGSGKAGGVLVLTPFFSLGFPTDTSRTREERRMPVRGVMDDRVFEGPYFLIEPGVAFAASLWVFSLYTHQGALFAPVHGQDLTHFYWAMHYGLSAVIIKRLEIVAEVSGLLRFTRDYNDERLFPWAFSPGFRVRLGEFSLELSARVGLNDDAYDPFGGFTLGMGVTWAP